MRSFRIYTENRNFNRTIRPILETYFDGFTVLRGVGNWKGTAENSVVIEIYTANARFIRRVADLIKKANAQDGILITETDCKIEIR